MLNRFAPMIHWFVSQKQSLLLGGALVFFGGGVWLSCSSGPVDKPADVIAAEGGLPDKVDYNLHVKPILSDRCFACHGPDANKQKAGLRLDIAQNAYEALAKSGHRAIVPGNLAKSELFHRITSTDPQVMMPTPASNLSLSAQEKAVLLRWIEQGAEYKEHWSLLAPVKPPLPVVHNGSWVKNEIDRFVGSKLAEKGLVPTGEADKATLLRRVSLDLTGLPPTPAEVDAFLADNSPNAYEKVVDKLLANPHYGERQAVDWLDVARYADTHGYQDDGPRNVWPYRDWVIRAYNQNLPFDKFVTWQLAGDMLPKPNRDMMIATAFNRNHQQSQEGGIVPEEYQAEYIADRTATFGKAFLGLTVECARCHDHKYDPISQKDYYSLGAFFAQNNEYGQIPYNGEPSPHITLPTPEAEAKLKFIRQKIAFIDQAARASRTTTAKQRFATWMTSARQKPAISLLPDRQDLVLYVPFDQYKDVLADQPKKGEKKGGKLAKKAVATPATKPTVAEVKKPKMRRLFQNMMNDTLPFETHGDLDFPIPTVKGPVGQGVKLVGESYLELKGMEGWNGYSKTNPVGWFERNQPFSVSLWVNVTDPKLKGPLFNRNNGPFNGFRGYQCLRLPDGRLAFQLNYVWPDDALDIETIEKLPLNRWVNLTVTYDGRSRADGLHLYANGQLLKTRTITDNLTQSTVWGKKKSNWGSGVTNFGIGQLSDQNYKGFSVDELRLYARKLTPLEIQGLVKQPQRGTNGTLLAALRKPTPSPADEAALFDYFLTNVDKPSQELRLMREQQVGDETRLMNEQEIDLMVMRERRFPRPTFILKRGAYDVPGERVYPESPHALPPMPHVSKNRLTLAQWLVSADNPLFARVMVNRLWQQYFGQGLVKSADDFGNQGNLPTHPELLDYLAVAFRESGWNVKAMHKRIVLSATYRQSSSVPERVRELDLDNSLLSRGPSYRMSAEQIRDNALAASGLLSQKIGGPSVKPYQPAGIWEALATRNAVNYIQNHGDSLYRRSLYTIWKRSAPPPMMLNFDAAERHFCMVKRQKTSTPLQALVTLNDPQFVEAARVLAQKSPPGAIDYMAKALLSRPARSEELKLMQQLYSEELADFRKNPKRATALLSVGEYPIDKSRNPAELAAWTVVASTMMNIDEAIIKR